MSTWLIIVLVGVALVVLVLLVLGSRKARQKRTGVKRRQADELRGEAHARSTLYERESATAEEQAARARRERAEAEERAAQLEREAEQRAARAHEARDEANERLRRAEKLDPDHR